ncbi:MAG: glycosyltransferase family 4 protein [Desulfatirhabdiaceae bacterium]
MKILFLAPHPFFQNRGTPIADKLMVESLASRNHQITLLTYPEGEDPHIPNSRIVRLPHLAGVNHIKPGFSWKKLLYDMLMAIYAGFLIQQEQFDVIHAVEESVFIASYLSSRLKIPYIYDMDSLLSSQMTEKYPFIQPFSFLMERLEKFVIRGSIGIITVCQEIENKVREYSPEKWIQRLEDITLLDNQSAKPVSLPIAPGSPVVMYVGNLETYQGIDLLLESFRLVCQSLTDAILVIVGGTVDDVNEYRNRSRKLGIDRQTVFVGSRPVEELGAYLSLADILVSPRIRGNNTPMKIYSYLDSGKAILATDLPTHTQVLDSEISVLVNPDPESMSKGMIRLITDRQLQKRLAANARARVVQDYTLSAYQGKLFRFYEWIEKRITG